MAENIPATPRRARTRLFIKTMTLTIFVTLVLLSSWTLAKYLHYTSLQGYILDELKLSFSTFQIEIALAGLTGLLASVLIQSRRRSRKAKVSPLKMTLMSFGTRKPVHPLMMTPRPSRDSKFVIRKTSKPGRISRNRMGERLPPTYIGETDTTPP